MFIHVSPTLSPATLLRAIVTRPPAASPSVTYFSYARGALITALNSIREAGQLAEIPAVWLPAFVCDTVLELLQAYAVTYRLYRIREDLTPDWEALQRADVKPGDIFVLVHFFGFPMAIEESVAFCRQNSLTLLEDCAHSIVKQVTTGGIGTHGAAGVFGLRKALPLPNGGFLFMKSLAVRIPAATSDEPSVYRGVSKMAVQWCLQKAGISWRPNETAEDKSVLPDYPRNYYHFRFSEGMSRWSARILNAVDLDAIIRARRRNFQSLVQGLRGVPSIRVPKTLNLDDPQTVPWVFFAYHHDSERLISRLMKDGISASSFPTLHREVFRRAEWQLENDLFRQAVTLPVHQDLSQHQLEHIIASVRRHA